MKIGYDMRRFEKKNKGSEEKAGGACGQGKINCGTEEIPTN